jgi:RNA polymerase sigma-70 factor, ECF subfamily
MDPTSLDLDIVNRTLAGDREAYAELVRRHHTKMIGLCASLLGNRTEAEDAAQEIFIKAFHSLSSFRQDSSFSTWLYRIASNHCLDLLRRRARQRSESLEALLERSGDKVETLFAAPSDPSSPEMEELAHQILASLPPDYRLILTLREAQGLSYQEIAKTLDISLDSVKARLHRARKLLEKVGQHFLARQNV